MGGSEPNLKNRNILVKPPTGSMRLGDNGATLAPLVLTLRHADPCFVRAYPWLPFSLYAYTASRRQNQHRPPPIRRRCWPVSQNFRHSSCRRFRRAGVLRRNWLLGNRLLILFSRCSPVCSPHVLRSVLRIAVGLGAPGFSSLFSALP